MNQKRFNQQTLIKPLSDLDQDYDIDLVCLLKNGTALSEERIKNIVGDRLKEHGTYKGMLDKEGKRCWTLLYEDFHMDILPAVPNKKIFHEPQQTEIRLTHKLEKGIYIPKYSNPYKYHMWFEERMRVVLDSEKRQYSIRNQVEIDKVATYKVKTPLQKAIQLLKRHRDIMFQTKDSNNAPISIIITTLAALSYKNETNLYEAICNIVERMSSFIQLTEDGQYVIQNPVMPYENFADKWNENHEKVKCFKRWILQVKEDIVNQPLSVVGVPEISDLMKKSFGERITQRAYGSLGEKTRISREDKKLYINGLRGGLTTEPQEKSSIVGGHTFFGK